MTLLGGIGTILGPIVGSTLVVMLQSELADRVGFESDDNHGPGIHRLCLELPPRNCRRVHRLARPSSVVATCLGRRR